MFIQNFLNGVKTSLLQYKSNKILKNPVQMETQSVLKEAMLIENSDNSLTLDVKLLKNSDMPDVKKFAILLKLIQNEYSPATDIINLILHIVSIRFCTFITANFISRSLSLKLI